MFAALHAVCTIQTGGPHMQTARFITFKYLLL
jgi:hypothetical protein